MKKILLLIILFPFVHSCNDWEDGRVDLIRSNTFVQGYCDIKGVLAYCDTDNCIWLYEYIEHILVWYSASHNSEKFWELSEKHSDKNFNRLVLDDQLLKNEYFSEDFSAITITSDRDFDEAHPAGTPLNDVARFITVTPARFIKSGYTDTFDWDGYEKLSVFKRYFAYTLAKTDGYKPGHITLGRENIFPVYKMVGELTADDMALLGRGVIQIHQQHGATDPFAVIEFTRTPATPGAHSVSIVITTDSGTTYRVEPLKVSFT